MAAPLITGPQPRRFGDVTEHTCTTHGISLEREGDANPLPGLYSAPRHPQQTGALHVQ